LRSLFAWERPSASSLFLSSGSIMINSTPFRYRESISLRRAEQRLRRPAPAVGISTSRHPQALYLQGGRSRQPSMETSKTRPSPQICADTRRRTFDSAARAI
jgi:hypothetical protein